MGPRRLPHKKAKKPKFSKAAAVDAPGDRNAGPDELGALPPGPKALCAVPAVGSATRGRAGSTKNGVDVTQKPRSFRWSLKWWEQAPGSSRDSFRGPSLPPPPHVLHHPRGEAGGIRLSCK